MTMLQLKWMEGSLSTIMTRKHKSRSLVCVWDDCTFTMWRWGMDLPFTAWPISDHCPFREASANQEALQGLIPQPTNLLVLPHHFFYHDWCFIYCWFIKWCFYNLCEYLHYCEPLWLVFVVFLMWRHVKSIFVCFRLWIPSVYFDISIYDVLLDFQKWWLRWECTRTLPVLCFLH